MGLNTACSDSHGFRLVKSIAFEIRPNQIRSQFHRSNRKVRDKVFRVFFLRILLSWKSDSIFSVFSGRKEIDISRKSERDVRKKTVFGKNRGIIDGGCFSREMTNGSVTTRRKFSGGKRKKKRKKKGKRKREKIMFAHRSTLLVYSLELPFASFIDFFSSRYENSFEWPDGTRGLLKADERVYFSVTENPKWRPDTGTPVEWPYKGNALNSSS